MKELDDMNPDEMVEEELQLPEGVQDAEDGAGTEQDGGTALSPLKEFTKNESVESRPNISLREILGGDILANGWLKRQIWLILLFAFFSLLYITNRYSSEQEMIEIEQLKDTLTDIRYRALTRSSELTVKTRQSQIEKQLRARGDSMLQSPKEPPFIIKSNRREE